MSPTNRREFLAEVSQGVFAATIGYGLASDLGLVTVAAAEEPARLVFGAREPLVALMQETPVDRLLPALVAQLRQGVSLQELVAAGALANARTFGGEDYVGFHTFMALAPAWHMAAQSPSSLAALPVLKVLYRNGNRIQEKGGASAEVLHPVTAQGVTESGAEAIRQAIHAKDLPRAERLLAYSAERSPQQAYDDLLPTVAEAGEVHRTVLAYRAWDLLELVGREHATTFLRQSLHYAIVNCSEKYEASFAEVRNRLPSLVDEYRLGQRDPGTRVADDAWLESMCQSLLTATPAQAADAVAAALAEGFSPDSLADAIALAANQLVLRDPGRTPEQAQPHKPAGSVHGDSIGVHSSDAANAWRNIARVSNRRNQALALVLSGWQVANDRRWGGNNLSTAAPRPDTADVEQVKSTAADALLQELDDAIRNQDQARACALTKVYGDHDYPVAPVQDLFLKYAVSQDGALHAEKYFRTATEEFARWRPAFRWRQMIALARVTASEYGQPAPGVEEARGLLGV